MELFNIKIAVDPGEWLSYIAKAEFVITNSFHGTAFSLIFEKNFMCLDMDCRIRDLLLCCELMGRVQQEIEAYESIKNTGIDYCRVKHMLGRKIALSHRFLETELKA